MYGSTASRDSTDDIRRLWRAPVAERHRAIPSAKPTRTRGFAEWQL